MKILVSFENLQTKQIDVSHVQLLVQFFHFFKEENSTNFDLSILVDSGYSETVVTVFANIDGKIIKIPKLTTRIPIGGKLMTNFLKQTISYKEVHVMDEFVMIDELKKNCLKISKNPETMDTECTNIEYLLPNFINRFSGRIVKNSTDRKKILKDDDCAQMIKLGNERLLAGEILFSPKEIIGMDVAGLAEVLRDTLEKIESFNGKDENEIVPIVFVGGNSLIEGFCERIEAEGFENVFYPENPITYAVEGVKYVDLEHVKNCSISKPQFSQFLKF